MSDLIFSFLAALLSCGLTAAYLRIMTASSRFELPNHRSMHTVPVPSGAGVAIVVSTLVLWPASQNLALESLHFVLLGGFAALALISWVDDHYRLAASTRLAAHALAVAAVLVWLGPDQRVVPALPLFIERAALGVAWLWFINLFNFMDGIDGIAGSEAIAIALGYIAVAIVGGLDASMELAAILAAASAGYLLWNWHPAKVFMGDTGSIPLGFLLGWLMIDLACRGHWAAALILPAYFVADATFTLFKRLQRGDKPWQPHREHFYQRAVLGGATASAVVWRITIANAALIALAALSTRSPVSMLIAGAAVVTGLLMHLENLARR